MQYFWMVVCCICGVAAAGYPANINDNRQWWGDVQGPAVVGSCDPALPSASLTIANLGCRAYVHDQGAWHGIDQPAVSVTLPAVDGPHCLAIHRSTSTTVAGWTRLTFGSHWLHQQATCAAAGPVSGALRVLELTVASSVISAIAEIAPRRVTTSETITHARTIQGDVTFTHGGLWANNTANAVTFDGARILAGNLQIFDGTGDFLFARHGVPINPLWYGVRGDGVTDDTAAINRTLTQAGAGAVIEWPRQTFIISADLLVQDQQRLEGNGATLRFADNIDFASLPGPAAGQLEVFRVNGNAGVHRTTIRNFIIDGRKEFQNNIPNDTPEPVAFGVRYEIADYNRIENLRFENFPGYGVAYYGAKHNYANGLVFTEFGPPNGTTYSGVRFDTNDFNDGVLFTLTGADPTRYAEHNLVENVSATRSLTGCDRCAFRSLVTFEKNSRHNTVREIFGQNGSRLVHFESADDGESRFNVADGVSCVRDLNTTVGLLDHVLVHYWTGQATAGVTGDNIVRRVTCPLGSRTPTSGGIGPAATWVVGNDISGAKMAAFSLKIEDADFRGNDVQIMGPVHLVGVKADNIIDLTTGSATPGALIENVTVQTINVPLARGITVRESRVYAAGSSIGGGLVTTLNNAYELSSIQHTIFTASDMSGGPLLTIRTGAKLFGNTFNYTGVGATTNSYINLSGDTTLNGVASSWIYANNLFYSTAGAVDSAIRPSGTPDIMFAMNNALIGTAYTTNQYNNQSYAPITPCCMHTDGATVPANFANPSLRRAVLGPASGATPGWIPVTTTPW